MTAALSAAVSMESAEYAEAAVAAGARIACVCGDNRDIEVFDVSGSVGSTSDFPARSSSCRDAGGSPTELNLFAPTVGEGHLWRLLKLRTRDSHKEVHRFQGRRAGY